MCKACDIWQLVSPHGLGMPWWQGLGLFILRTCQIQGPGTRWADQGMWPIPQRLCGHCLFLLLFGSGDSGWVQDIC